MSDRGGVRSSARLSGDTAAPAPAPRAPPRAAPRAPGASQGRGRPMSTTAAAAQRRARAAERAAEVEDSPRVLRDKCRRLARALRNAKHLVVYTGAGISTAADIPDYRGPHGVWTRLQRGETVGRVEVSRAQPTFTHMALTALWARGTLKFVVSQNCDGLHLRAGLPRRALAELHGDMFAELCAPCRRVYLRAFDTTERTARHQHGTRRLCHACGAELRDSIVHFGERGRAAWPLNWAGALRHAARADVVLCLGSSLKVLRRYPRLWRMQSAPRARPALYIVNLQWTPKDSVAALKINARCDAVMRQVARRLRLRVPRYRAALDPVLAHAEPLAPPEAHTTRRPALRADSRAPSSSDWELSSPSASDSDEELPLRRLADRLRGPAHSDRLRSPSESSRTLSPSESDFLHKSHESEFPKPHQSERLPISYESNRPHSLSPVIRQHDASASDRLYAFQVSLLSGEATILLRAEHAPPPRRSPPPRASPPCCRTADLRRFRMAKHPSDVPFAVNGHAPPGVAADTRPPPASPMGNVRLALPLEHARPALPLGHARPALPLGHARPALPLGHARTAPPLGHARLLPPMAHARLAFAPSHARFATSPGDVRSAPVNGAVGLGSRLRRLLEFEPRIDVPTKVKTIPADLIPKVEADAKIEPKSELKEEAKEEASTSESESGALAAGSLAAAIIRRAVLLCRASLYPGLHTIISPPPAPAPCRPPPSRPPQCAWCARHFAARRCLWYGAPREPPAAARVWRRVRARRYLCACCGRGEAGEPRDAPDCAEEGGGWYGKGYRKGRRRRR